MTATTPLPPPPPPRTSGPGAARVVAVLAGSIAALLAFGLLVGAAALGWAHATQRDDDGWYRSRAQLFETDTRALASDRIDLGADVADGWWGIPDDIGTARITTESADGSALFVGIGPSAEVAAYLDGVAHDRVVHIDDRPFRAEYERRDGTRAPPAPGAQDLWAASASGTGTQVVEWDIEAGDWTVVVMRPDAGEGVRADISVGVRTGLLLPIAVVLAVAALLGFGVAAVLLLVGLRHDRSSSGPPVDPSASAPVPLVAPTAYPARLDARLDAGLSRWLWAVKWVLVLPHLFVLALLWPAFLVLTVVAGVAILFTGRYPRAIFDFNVGVLRWTWRVGHYSLAAFGTDRYPPFRLEPEPGHPADLAVEYPERLSRGLVLVKWWLLALPHLLIVSVLAGGWGAGLGDDGRFLVGGGLIGVVVLVAGLVLAVRGTYPPELFHFVMGLNRWCFRVAVYVALMRDEYPPFRFDGGGTDPGTRPVVPPTPPPTEPPAQEPDDRPLVAPGR